MSTATLRPFPLLVMLLIVCLHIPDADARQRGLQPADYHRFQFVSDPQISPDGRMVAFVRSVVSDDRRSRESSIWMVPSDGSREAIRFTYGTSDRSPRWSPDGTNLAFLANRDGKARVWLIPVDGGEARALVSSEHNIGSFSWSPDGSRILVRISSEQNDGKDGNNGANKTPKPDIHVVTTSLYKADGRGILGPERNHLWVYDLAADTLMQLTSSTNWNAGGGEWSPDGRMVVFHADTTGNEYEGGYSNDLFRLTVDEARGSLPALTGLTHSPARSTGAVWAPDGRTLAFSFTEGRYEKSWIYLIDADGSRKRNAAAELDLLAGNLTWAPDSRHLYFQASERGGTGLYRLDTRNGEIVTLIHGPFSIGGITFSSDGRRLAFTMNDENRLAEVWTARTDDIRSTRTMSRVGTGAPRIESAMLQPLTRFNQAMLDTLDLSPVESFWFTSDAGTPVQGFLVRPVGWEEGKSYPVVLNIKGGPGGMWGHQWFHEFQMMAAKGYAVFFTNYRGSHGYGFDHQSAVHQDYGGADYRDNMSGLDSVLGRNPWIDRDRQYITGGSHGGFLTNWIIAQHPGRFRAAVTQRSVSNWISEAGTQEYTPQAMREEFGGTIWENFDYYWGRSPLKYADRITTPTLVIHSDRDETTPLGQGKEFYYALKINGVETEMVIFQGESHGLSRGGRPVNLVERLDRILDWFGRYP